MNHEAKTIRYYTYFKKNFIDDTDTAHSFIYF